MVVDEQHGSVQGRSTISNLFLFKQNIGDSINNRLQVGNDFAKAIDQIDHNILMHKLRYLGFSNDLVDFFVLI